MDWKKRVNIEDTGTLYLIFVVFGVRINIYITLIRRHIYYTSYSELDREQYTARRHYTRS